MLDAVQLLGTSWKKIAHVINDQFEQQRTAENIKDKYKSIGGKNADKRKTGEWQLKETLNFLNLIGIATDAEIISPNV